MEISEQKRVSKWVSRAPSIAMWVVPVVLLVVIGDQYTKNLIQQLVKPLEVVSVIDGFFNLTLHYNKGAAFGMFHSLPDGWRQLVLWGVSGVAVLAVLYFLFEEYYTSALGKFSLSLILGGAVGNAMDRFSQGQVVDFLDFYFGSYHWPAFNLADSAISVGAVLLIYLSLFPPRLERNSISK